MQNIQALLKRLATLLCCCALLACGSMGAHTVTVPMDQLQASLAKRFPMNTSFAQLFELSIDTPKLSALPAANRMATELQLTLTPKFTQRSFKGSLSLDSELRYEASDNTVRLVSPRVQKFELPGFKLSDTSQGDLNLRNLAAAFIEQALNDTVVHQVQPQALQHLGTTWQPQDIKVTASGLAVTLMPQK
jgi:hypothetical protein